MDKHQICDVKGLSEPEVEKSKETHGTNELAKKPKASIFSMFLDACNVICSFDYEGYYDFCWVVHR